MSVALAFSAMLIELCVGYPDSLVRAIGHPVSWMGRLIAALDRLLNPDIPPYPPSVAVAAPGHARIAGMIALLIVLCIVASIAFILQYELLRLPLGFAALAVTASCLIAQRSLHQHVTNVAIALERDGVAAARVAVSHIVGRDSATLDASGVARAAIESLAENFSDGIVAPILWMVIAGLPGAALYKAINTADSMIGHRTPRYQDFGWASARLDDLVNLPASRLAALLVIVAAALGKPATAGAAWRTMRRDAARHRSPNAGYPEAAMAGALNLSLAGPRSYDGVLVDDALMGDGRRDATADDIRRALKLYRRADGILLALVTAAACIVIGIV